MRAFVVRGVLGVGAVRALWGLIGLAVGNGGLRRDGLVEDCGWGRLGVDSGAGEEFGGGEALGHGVSGAARDLVKGFEGVGGVTLGADFGLEIGEFLAEI